MTTRPLLMVYFAAWGYGVHRLRPSVFLLRKFYHLMWRSPLRPRLRQILFGATWSFVALMYMPYPLHILYKWPEQEVSPVVLYGLLYPFSLWGMISVSTFLIVLVSGSWCHRVHPMEAWVSCTWAVGQPLAEPLCTTRRSFCVGVSERSRRRQWEYLLTEQPSARDAKSSSALSGFPGSPPY